MILFLTAVICVFAFSLLCYLFWQKTQPRVSTTLVVGLTAALVVGLVAMIASGRLHWLMGIAATVLPFLRRGLGLLRFASLFSLFNRLSGGNLGATGFAPFSRSADTSGPSTSETETGELKMVLDHNTQEISGTVLKGSFAGQTLSSLSKEDLLSLYAELEEEQSIRLLSTFINRYHPDIEMDTAGEDKEVKSESDSMDHAKARAILGVAENATREEIVGAYKRLIQHLHPDRGGSSYLASELNEAKNVLLGDLT